MGPKRTDEFRKDAVRIALTSGLTRKQVADDPGIGMSTLNKWVTAHRDTDVVSKEDLSLAQENDRLRRENRILKEEREILKKGRHVAPLVRATMAASSSRAKSHEVQVCRSTFWVFPDGTPLQDHGRQPTRFAGLPQPSRQSQAAVRSGDTCTYQRTVPSQSGQLRQAADDRRADGDRPGCRASACGQIDATERHFRCQDPQTQGHDHCPAGDYKAICREGDSDHKFNIDPICWTATLCLNTQTRNGQATSATSGRVRVGYTSLSSRICIPGASSVGPSEIG